MSRTAASMRARAAGMPDIDRCGACIACIVPIESALANAHSGQTGLSAGDGRDRLAVVSSDHASPQHCAASPGPRAEGGGQDDAVQTGARKRLLIASPRGFCAGVSYAIEI